MNLIRSRLPNLFSPVRLSPSRTLLAAIAGIFSIYADKIFS
ncbi:hypothetical protein UNSWDHB_1715 [Dehalobacter sp. UNSWDHB]|nr:hypothetical protein UNSWDHB_1715 [Dehalobacter sp. UNSWDHB]